MSKLRICYFGLLDPEYERNRILISGLCQNDTEMVLCISSHRGVGAYWSLIKSWKAVGRNCDVVIVGYSDRRIGPVILAKILFRCPVVWDAFYSLYDSYVYDRKLVLPSSIKARYYWCLDWLGCIIATRILLDTESHIRYFMQTFYMPHAKFIRSFVGASDDIFKPGIVKSAGPFRVLFFGHFIPLQGASIIIQAAKILEDRGFIFEVIGRGQTYQACRELARKIQSPITFVDELPISTLSDKIAQFDVVLGIFGSSDKAKRVIPNKVYEAIAMAKPVITTDTPAIRELFTDRENILLCRKADPWDLASKILELKNNPKLRQKIAEGGYELFKKHATPRVIGVKLTKLLENLYE